MEPNSSKFDFIPYRIASASRLLIGIAGIPASGKSTLAKQLVDQTNKLVDGQAILVGLDGWHLSRVQLDAFPDPALAHARRGSHWTFDAAAYLTFVHRLRQPISGGCGAITAPSFDHALKDPTPDAVRIRPMHRLVIIEGLYVYLSIEPWAEAGRMLDERWWIEVNEGDAKNRLILRHVASGVAKDEAEAKWRADENDMPSPRLRCL